MFCGDIISGAEEYLRLFKDTDLYKKNYRKFMQRYPNGLLPYIKGVPVIG